MTRFIHDSTKSTSAPIGAVPISVDTNLSRAYQSRRQLHLTPLDTQNQDVPPPLPAKPQTNMNNADDNCTSNDHIVQDGSDVRVYDKEKFRQRTAAVISSADGKKYRAAYCKSKNGNSTQQPITSQEDHHNTCTVNTTNPSSKESCSDKPPPLPPKPPPLPQKPVRSRKPCAKKDGASSSSIKSVYQYSTHTESLSLLEERALVQPSQLQRRLERCMCVLYCYCITTC